MKKAVKYILPTLMLSGLMAFTQVAHSAEEVMSLTPIYVGAEVPGQKIVLNSVYMTSYHSFNASPYEPVHGSHFNGGGLAKECRGRGGIAIINMHAQVIATSSQTMGFFAYGDCVLSLGDPQPTK